MAVTVQSQPQAYHPVYNPQWFVATSTQTAQPNFRYTVVLTDLVSSASVTKDVDPDPNGWCRLDVGSFAEQYMTQVCPSNLYGFQLNTGGIRKIRVNIGETYGTTPTYYAGSNIEYIVWNASLPFLEMQSYDYTNYVYDRGSSRLRYLTSVPAKNSGYTYGNTGAGASYFNEDKTYSGRSTYLYAITALPGTYDNLEEITVVCYDAAGNTIGTTVVGNPYAASATYTDKYVFIDIGYDGLANMPAGQILSGTNPIPISQASYYDIRDTNTGVGAGASASLIKRIYVVCEPKFDLVGLHYIGTQGQFDTQVCAKLSTRNSESTKNFYSKLPYSYSGYDVVYNYTSAVENVQTATHKDKITVNTDWLEVWEASKLKEAISSPICYADLGSSSGYVAVKMMTNTYTEKKKYNEQMFFATFDLEYAHTNIRQRA